MVTETEVTVLAQNALLYLADDPELMGAFLAGSGLAVSDLRGAAQSPDFAAAILDFVCERDDRVLALADAAGVRPERISLIRAALEAGRIDAAR